MTVEIPYIGEPDVVVQFDYLAAEPTGEHFTNPEVENILASILAMVDEGESMQGTMNLAPQRASLDTLCASDKPLCTITTFLGSLSDTEKYNYLKQLQFLLRELDSYAKRGATLRETLQTFILNQTKADRRGSAGRSKITINLGGMKYENEYFQVLTHEMGHIVDLGSLQGKSKTKHANFTEFGKSVFAVDDPSLEYYKYSRQSESIRKS